MVKENQNICKGKWDIPAGGLDQNESLIEGAKREIYEETGCKVEITGILEIISVILEGVNTICFLFDTKIIYENIKADRHEISEVKGFTFEEILNIKGELRADGYFLSTIKNKMGNKIQSTEIIKTIKN